MNVFTRTLGFKNMTSADEATLIRECIEKAFEEEMIIKAERMDRGVAVARLSASTGLYIYGRFTKDKFIFEYYHPFVIGTMVSDNDEITIERHLDKESYAVVCDEMKTGVTLIFYLQNVIDYYGFMSRQDGFSKELFDPDKMNAVSKIPLKKKKTVMSALSLGGMILLPIYKDKKTKKGSDKEVKRHKMIEAAKKGDQTAIENLTYEDIDTYNKLSRRILTEDVFTIVDSSFMPCGVECDQYSVVGEILAFREEENNRTGEKIVIMELESNELRFTVAVARDNLVGEPGCGRRFKGQVWLQGTVKFN